MSAGIVKAANIFDSINSFEDIERIFLKGQGLSPNTYRSYLGSVKLFYDFMEGLNPLQGTAGDIESFYDATIKKNERKTAYIRIQGLKKFFAGIRKVITFYTSPFEAMPEKLKKKLSKTKKGNRTKTALSKNEMKALLSFLQADNSIQGTENYSIVYI